MYGSPTLNGANFSAVPNSALVTAVIPSSATGTYALSTSGNAATVTTNANLSGNVTSIGNATTIVTIPAVSGASLTSLTAANISAGSLGASVIASSITQAAMYGNPTFVSITASTITVTSGGQAIVLGSATIGGDLGIKTYSETQSSETISGATYNLEWSSATARYLVIKASTTITFSGAAVGKSMSVIAEQGATKQTLTWPSIKWKSGVVPTLSTMTNHMDLYNFYYTGTKYIGTYDQDYY
jgi:hypothetical protein